MSKIFNYTAAAIIAFLLILWYYQNRKPGAPLLPGEHYVAEYAVPVFASGTDSKCLDSLKCVFRSPDASLQTFTVSKDTTYFLTVDYISNGSSVMANACGAVLLGDSIVMHRVAGCHAAAKSVDFAHLQPGKKYTLSISLHRCAEEVCVDGTKAIATAAVSLKKPN